MDTIEVNGLRLAYDTTGQIAYWTSGHGLPLVLVHGTTVDHTNSQALSPHLERHVIVHAIDRRGGGASSDASDHQLAREYEDVAAVIDAVAATSGSRLPSRRSRAAGATAGGRRPREGTRRHLPQYRQPLR